MLLIWRGYGLAVPVLAFGAVIAARLLADHAFGAGYADQHSWPGVAAALVFLAALWPLGRHVNRDRMRTVLDPQSGLEFRHDPGYHSFFLVPMEWAALALAVSVLLSAALLEA